MNIATRNLLRLLRAGVYGTKENVEPMSAWKWQRVQEVAAEQCVAAATWTGIEKLQGQFFLQLPDACLDLWRNCAAAEGADEAEDVAAVLTNRLNRRKFQQIKKEAEASTAALRLIESSLLLTHHIISDGLFLRPLLRMADALADTPDTNDYTKWTAALHMERMAGLQYNMVNVLRGEEGSAIAEQAFDELFDRRRGNGQLHFQQHADAIFVHTSNSRAMLWQARRSAKFFSYCPSESFTTLVSSFARSLTDIEE